ncbi:MAG: hypothetical protein HY509_00165 [Acidobacteria bacterium]|nr:hypothetical protein [Acidobacteriota bacterium]
MRWRWKRRLGWPAAAAFLLPGAAAGAPDLEERFAGANRLYEAGRHAEAAAEYEAIRGSGVEDEILFYNLGNAYFKQQRLGLALLNYERAFRLAPKDREIAANRELARSLVYDRIPAPAPAFPIDAILRLHGRMSVDAYTRLFLAVYLTGSGLLAGVLMTRGRPVRRVLQYACAAALLLTLAGGSALAWKAHALGSTVQVIVLEEKVDVRSAPGEDGTVLFTVHEGLQARVRNQREEWLQVSLPNGWTGWVPRAAVGIV